MVDAYEIQLVNIRRKFADGARVRGHKVGLSSPVMQQMMGVDEPDYGHLLDAMVLRQDAPIPAARYCYPRIEVEIGYVLGRALPGAGCTVADVLAATAYIVPSLELIDSRITDWRIKLADTIADNASSAGVILGAERKSPAELAAAGVDLSDIDAVLSDADGRRRWSRRPGTPARCSATRPPASPGWRGRWPTSRSSSRPGTSSCPVPAPGQSTPGRARTSAPSSRGSAP